jgi:hypothetical protein
MAKDKSIKKQLKGLDDWGDTPEKSFDKVDPGKYQAKIEAAAINNAKSSGRLQVSWELTIINGDFQGRKLFKHDGIDTVEGRSFFRGTLAKLGHEWPDDPEDLPEVLEELLETYVAVTVRNRKDDEDNINIYFDKALDSDDVEDNLGEDQDAGADEDDSDDDEKKSKKAKKDKSSKKRSKDEDDDDPDEDEDDKDSKKKSKKDKKSKDDDDDPEEDDTAEYTAEDIREMSKKELKSLVKENELKVDCTEDVEDIQAAVIAELGLDEGGKDDDKPEEIECEVTFKDKDVTADKKMKKKFIKLAEEAELDPEDYDKLTDMIVELAEHHGISGSFKKPQKLLDAIIEAAE